MDVMAARWLLLIVVVVLGFARLAVTYLQSENCCRREGLETYQILISLYPKKMLFFERLNGMILACGATIAFALVGFSLNG